MLSRVVVRVLPSYRTQEYSKVFITRKPQSCVLINDMMKMRFVIGECQNYVYSLELLSELCLLSGSVIKMIVTIGECYQNDVHYREVLCSPLGSVISYLKTLRMCIATICSIIMCKLGYTHHTRFLYKLYV